MAILNSVIVYYVMVLSFLFKFASKSQMHINGKSLDSGDLVGTVVTANCTKANNNK